MSNKYKHMIRWTNKKGEFVLVQAESVAKLWGLKKDRNHRMNYDKLSRALRYYYQKNIIQKVHGHKFVYQFIDLRELLKAYRTASVDREGVPDTSEYVSTPPCQPNSMQRNTSVSQSSQHVRSKYDDETESAVPMFNCDQFKSIHSITSASHEPIPSLNINGSAQRLHDKSHSDDSGDLVRCNGSETFLFKSPDIELINQRDSVLHSLLHGFISHSTMDSPRKQEIQVDHNFTQGSVRNEECPISPDEFNLNKSSATADSRTSNFVSPISTTTSRSNNGVSIRYPNCTTSHYPSSLSAINTSLSSNGSDSIQALLNRLLESNSMPERGEQPSFPQSLRHRSNEINCCDVGLNLKKKKSPIDDLEPKRVTSIRPPTPHCTCSCHNHVVETSSLYLPYGDTNCSNRTDVDSGAFQGPANGDHMNLHHQRHAINMFRLGEQLSRINRVKCTADSNGMPNTEMYAPDLFGPSCSLQDASRKTLPTHSSAGKRPRVDVGEHCSAPFASQFAREDSNGLCETEQCVWMPVPIAMLNSWFALLNLPHAEQLLRTKINKA